MSGYKRGSGKDPWAPSKPRKTKVVNAEIILGHIVRVVTEKEWCVDLIEEFGEVRKESRFIFPNDYTLYVNKLYSDPQDVVDYINSFNRRPAKRDLDIKIEFNAEEFKEALEKALTNLPEPKKKLWSITNINFEKETIVFNTEDPVVVNMLLEYGRVRFLTNNKYLLSYDNSQNFKRDALYLMDVADKPECFPEEYKDDN